ncbi:MAG: hypothetical protein EU532_01425 [Promethearchaeota archaeon]|nr:MAG: hypothetical protein EU532_01425 [Candidatus Lokiarchaeota archaeon]
MERLIKQSDVNYFLSEIEQIFPNFIAGVLCDRHGFPIASKIPQNFHIQENILALSAISDKKDLLKGNGYVKVKRNVDKSKNIKLLLLLDKNYRRDKHFKQLKKLIETQILF